MNNNYDEKGNAKHYSDQRIDMIRMLEQIWGTQNLMIFCEMNAFKYRMRLGKKDDPTQEMIKISWYEKMAQHLKEDLEKGRNISGLEIYDSGMFESFKNKL